MIGTFLGFYVTEGYFTLFKCECCLMVLAFITSLLLFFDSISPCKYPSSINKGRKIDFNVLTLVFLPLNIHFSNVFQDDQQCQFYPREHFTNLNSYCDKDFFSNTTACVLLCMYLQYTVYNDKWNWRQIFSEFSVYHQQIFVSGILYDLLKLQCMCSGYNQ